MSEKCTHGCDSVTDAILYPRVRLCTHGCDYVPTDAILHDDADGRGAVDSDGDAVVRSMATSVQGVWGILPANKFVGKCQNIHLDPLDFLVSIPHVA
eukprot:gene1031-biopygen10744